MLRFPSLILVLPNVPGSLSTMISAGLLIHSKWIGNPVVTDRRSAVAQA